MWLRSDYGSNKTLSFRPRFCRLASFEDIAYRRRTGIRFAGRQDPLIWQGPVKFYSDTATLLPNNLAKCFELLPFQDDVLAGEVLTYARAGALLR